MDKDRLSSQLWRGHGPADACPNFNMQHGTQSELYSRIQRRLFRNFVSTICNEINYSKGQSVARGFRPKPTLLSHQPRPDVWDGPSIHSSWRWFSLALCDHFSIYRHIEFRHIEL
jgi:hypothetical protein